MTSGISLIYMQLNFIIEFLYFKKQRKQTYMTLNKDFSDNEQLIVNQRCNLIIQYLERQSIEKLQFEAEKVILLI